MLDGALHLGVTKVELSRRVLLPYLFYVGLLALAVSEGAQGAAPLWKSSQSTELGGVKKSGKSGSLERRAWFRPCDFCKFPALYPPQGVVFT